MSTTKPRITITLEPRAYQVVSRLSEATGKSMSSVVTDFLDLAMPQMERMLSVMEAARRAPDQAHERIKRALEKAEQALVPALVEVIEDTDRFMAEEGIDWEDLAQGQLGFGVGEPSGASLSNDQAGRVLLRGRKRTQPPGAVTRGVDTPKSANKAKAKGSTHG